MLGISIGRVTGNSMMPRILPNAFFIAIKYPRILQRINHVYYIEHHRYGRIVKTLDTIEKNELWFRGESHESISKEAIGAIKQKQIIGRVIWVIKP